MKDLIEKIRKIEDLIQGASTAGEKHAAVLAKERINKRLGRKEKNKIIEYTLYTQDSWHKKLLLAICRKYKVEPYRYNRQKYTTVMVKVEENFLQNVLWKEYLEYSKYLEILVEDVTDNLIEKIYKHKEENIIKGELK